MCIHINFLMSIYVLLVCLYIKIGMSIHKTITVYIYLKIGIHIYLLRYDRYYIEHNKDQP